MTASRANNAEKESALEDTLEALVLPAYVTDGHVIQAYAVSRKARNPDFWVLDARNRQWLIECKNEARGLYGAGRKWSRIQHRWMDYSNNTEWRHNLSWAKSHILNKDWRQPIYLARSVSGVTANIPIYVENARPMLVSSFFKYDDEATTELVKLFGKNIVTVGHQLTSPGMPSEAFLVLFEGLRERFLA